jgi:hypothetical protein
LRILKDPQSGKLEARQIAMVAVFVAGLIAVSRFEGEEK